MPYAGLQLLESLNYLTAKVGLRPVSRSNWVESSSRLIGMTGVAEALRYYANAIQGQSDSISMEANSFVEFCIGSMGSSRSQWCQDLFVLYATNGLRDGRFLEAGAADGYTHSNTLSLEIEFGWSGILVEPDPSMFRELSLVRGHGNQLVNAALNPGLNVTKAELRRVRQLSALEGFIGKDLHEKTRRSSKLKSMVDLVSLEEMLKTSPKVNYLSLDVEGAEWDIVNSVNWDGVPLPEVITVECNYREIDEEVIVEKFEALGYHSFAITDKWLTRGDLWFTFNKC